MSNVRRKNAGEQTLYWGETIINLCCDDGYAMWAVPVMDNNRIISHMVVQGIDLEAGGKPHSARIQRAAETLLEWAVRDNLISAAVIRMARERALEQKDRFYALEQTKHCATFDLRSLYLREEPNLLAAIKNGEPGEARAILNRILINIYSLGSQRMDLLKSCVLELIVMMSRAAVEAGADPSAILGNNYRSLVELAVIDDEEDLARWVRHMLNLLIEAIQNNHTYSHSLLLSKALAYMRDRLGENLRRDEVARFAGVSPGHLATLMSEHMGKSFTDLLAQMRLDRARDLLRSSDLNLGSIALECGFYDQSHLNKAFRKYLGQSPGQFRNREGRMVRQS